MVSSKGPKSGPLYLEIVYDRIGSDGCLQAVGRSEGGSDLISGTGETIRKMILIDVYHIGRVRPRGRVAPT